MCHAGEVPYDGLCFRGKELGWGVPVCLGEGSWVCLDLRDKKVLEYEFILYRIRLVFPKSALLKQLCLWKRQVGSWPCEAFGVLSWAGAVGRGHES